MFSSFSGSFSVAVVEFGFTLPLEFSPAPFRGVYPSSLRILDNKDVGVSEEPKTLPWPEKGVGVLGIESRDLEGRGTLKLFPPRETKESSSENMVLALTSVPSFFFLADADIESEDVEGGKKLLMFDEGLPFLLSETAKENS